MPKTHAPCFPPQDPSYPVYVDSSVIMGMTGGHNGTGFDGIEYMLCSADNGFFPDLSKVGWAEAVAWRPCFSGGWGLGSCRLEPAAVCPVESQPPGWAAHTFNHPSALTITAAA